MAAVFDKEESGSAINVPLSMLRFLEPEFHPINFRKLKNHFCIDVLILNLLRRGNGRLETRLRITETPSYQLHSFPAIKVQFTEKLDSACVICRWEWAY